MSYRAVAPSRGGRAASRTPATVPESMGTSGARRSGIFLGDEVALLAVLLDHREARFFLEHGGDALSHSVPD